MLPENVTLEMLEKAFKEHNRKTCKTDCCILCFRDDMESDSNGNSTQVATLLAPQGVGINTSAFRHIETYPSCLINFDAVDIMKYAKDYETGY